MPKQVLLFRLLSGQGMLLVLLLLCGLFSALTFRRQTPTGGSAGRQLARDIVQQYGKDQHVLIAAGTTVEEAAFVDSLNAELSKAGVNVLATVKGEPRDARIALDQIARQNERLDRIACSQLSAGWLVFADLKEDYPTLANATVVTPQSYWWPSFLNSDNLLNIAQQIAVIAIVAIGMTMVIVTGGIDLSVGSVIALSAVLSTLLIQQYLGNVYATPIAMIGASLTAILICGLIGFFNGAVVLFFRVPSFIVTLAMMFIASGLAEEISHGESVYRIPESFTWLGRGTGLLGIPYTVLLMGVLYILAHILMSRTVLGRYLYAVGGNREAARLSGVPINSVTMFAYVCSGLLAGLGGVIMASQLKSGSMTYGQSYELYVIAAVVVGGTSLFGGEGKMTGTLVGAFIIAVIRNGMNLMNLAPGKQKIVFGGVILLAVVLDSMKHFGWKRLRV
ncbi:MAG TPA: ABC transporter permease [Gemmataceae bacterium]|jgi:ribose transport system permease protein|nr:ABC transporter permease [Gemmataceae bacterium]